MTKSNSSRSLAVLGLILLSVFARSILLRGNLWRLAEDVDDYLRLARNLADWGTLGDYDRPSAFRPPLYPLMLAPVYWLEGRVGLAWGWRVTAIAFLHLVLGTVTTVLTYQLGRRWGMGRWSLLAGSLVATDPLLCHLTRLPMTETPAAMFVVAGLSLLDFSRRRESLLWTGLAGLVLGLGVLCRTTCAAVVLIAVGVGAYYRDEQGRKSWEWALAVLLFVLAVQIPWALRNWLGLGSPILTTTHGGYTLHLANNSTYYDEVVVGNPFIAWNNESLERWQIELRMRSLLAGARTEQEYDAYCYREAWRTIRTRPGAFAASVLLRILDFWRVAPHATESYGSAVRVACAAWYVPQFLLILLALLNRCTWRWPFVLLPVTLLSFTLVHAVYWSNMRMRAPIVPAIALTVAQGAQSLGRRRQ